MMMCDNAYIPDKKGIKKKMDKQKIQELSKLAEEFSRQILDSAEEKELCLDMFSNFLDMIASASFGKIFIGIYYSLEEKQQKENYFKYIEEFFDELKDIRTDHQKNSTIKYVKYVVENLKDE